MRKISPTLLGILLIQLFFAALVAASYLFRKTEFRADIPSIPARSAIALETSLPVLLPQSNNHSKSTPLKELAKDSPRGLLLNFWATWCPPCIEELPSLETFHRQALTKPAKALPRLVTIAVDERPEDVLSFVKTLTYSFSLLVLHDPDGAFTRSLGTTRFPETYWVTPDGTIRHKWVGPQNWLSAEVLKTLQAEPESE